MKKFKINYYSNSCIYAEYLKNFDWFIFLDSCNDVSNFGRYDILSCNPNIKITSYGKNINVQSNNLNSSFYDDPFEIIKKYHHTKEISKEFPFSKGLMGYFGYEALDSSKDSLDEKIFPNIAVGFYDWAVIVDHEKRESWIVYDNKNSLIDYLSTKFLSKNLSIKQDYNNIFYNFEKNTSKEKYMADVKTIKSYIKNGDCYQVNYSQNFTCKYDAEPWNIYKDIRNINPAPYSTFFSFNDMYIISSSPERFISTRNGIVETKPIKGTLKRLKDKILDDKQIDLLKNDEKNRAENLMIVDLLRNDLSKCCKLNSVKVDKLFDIESYASVHHMVSTISGELENNMNSLDILKACFPGGSITGAPKQRSMEIIKELEHRDRDIYCGSVGYLDENNTMDTNICIRTIMLEKNSLSFSAGGGIVHDSSPTDEYLESLEKVSKFLKYFSNGEFKW